MTEPPNEQPPEPLSGESAPAAQPPHEPVNQAGAAARAPLSTLKLVLLGLMPSLIHIVVLLIDPGLGGGLAIYVIFMPVFALAWLLILRHRLRRRSPEHLTGCAFSVLMLLLNSILWVAGCATLLKFNF